MTFIDDLALVEVLVGMVAVLFTYLGLLCWWYIRSNNAKQLKDTLRASSIPVGAVGGVTLGLGLWIEVTWPFSVIVPIAGVPTNVLAGYNIFFGDAMMLFGLVAMAFAAAAYLGHHMHLVGLLAAVAGVVLAFYGWCGYTAGGSAGLGAGSKAFTLDPLDTLMLYGSFGLAAAFSFPASIVLDYYLTAVEAGRSIWQTTKVPKRTGLRAINAVRGSASIAGVPEGTSKEGELHYRAPMVVQLLMLAFPVLWCLAAIAAFWYFGVTLPGHLGGGASAAP